MNRRYKCGEAANARSYHFAREARRIKAYLQAHNIHNAWPPRMYRHGHVNSKCKVMDDIQRIVVGISPDWPSY